jgi:secreted trypsin-like serine protease
MKLPWLSSSKLLSLLLVVFSLAVSEAIIVRHDVGSDAYVVDGIDYPAVFFLERQGARKICVATVIHRQWAITAAHCLQETMLGETLAQDRRFGVELATGVREIDLAIVHPDYDQSAASDVDLALLRFREAETIPRPLALYSGSDEQGQVAALLGWGFTGLGTTGRQYDDGRLRRAVNRIEQTDSRLRLRFDDPRGEDQESLNFEGTIGLGDSGGPALIEADGLLVLAGIAIGEVRAVDYSEERQGAYGAVTVYERISRHLDWIQSVIGDELPFDS